MGNLVKVDFGCGVVAPTQRDYVENGRLTVRRSNAYAAERTDVDFELAVTIPSDMWPKVAKRRKAFVESMVLDVNNHLCHTYGLPGWFPSFKACRARNGRKQLVFRYVMKSIANHAAKKCEAAAILNPYKVQFDSRIMDALNMGG